MQSGRIQFFLFRIYADMAFAGNQDRVAVPRRSIRRWDSREVLQAIWTIKSLGLVKLICLLTPHGKGYFVCAKPKVEQMCAVHCGVYSV